MKHGLRAFLEGIVDYAGLFPPAELEFERAVANYLAFRRVPEAWMLGRFVCPVGRLASLGAALDALGPRGEPVRVSAIAHPLASLQEMRTQLHEDLVLMHGLAEQTGGRAVVECVELRLPLEAGSSRQAAGEAIDGLALQIVETGTRAGGPESSLLEAYAELAPGSALGNAVTFVTGALAGRPGLGFKLRCGGATPQSVPEPPVVAHALAACRDHRVPFKATAGLHHPVRHHDAGLDVAVHGFLNVFGAALLAHAHGLGEDDLCRVLEDQSAASFVFDDEGFWWHARQVPLAQIESARARLVTSFGSCSFDEPREDLHGLGLL